MEQTVKYLCLVYGEEAAMASVSDGDCLKAGQAMKESGHYLAAESLQPLRTAKTVRVRNGQTLITDGPFAETKEFLAGFYLIDAESLDEALEIASTIPPARVGSIEVRPIRELRRHT